MLPPKSVKDPEEERFANRVRQNIANIRRGEYHNLGLFIDSLKNLIDLQVTSGFHTWHYATGTLLGADTCREIGQRVCEEEEFTLEEASQLMEIYHHKEAKKYGLFDTASWDEIFQAQNTQIPVFQIED